MGISLGEATETLLTGKKLAWPKYKDHKAGSITLAKPAQRRLFEFLLSCKPGDVVQSSESLFDGVVKAWGNTEHDPATGKIEASAAPTSQSWRLDRIEACGFGGLTMFGGRCFDLFVGGSNWCLEGQNGSGKTSLISAVLWALTGKRMREHDGPVDERGERQSVEDSDGKSIGKWPPLAAYPTIIADLGKEAEVWVRLTFKAANGDSATAYRRMVSPVNGIAQIEEKIDPPLRAAQRLTEIGVLMPARLTKIGFGNESQSLFEAVKQLTGLDQLSDIAEGCSAFGAANRKFLKYAKDQGLDNHKRRFDESIESVKKLADEFQFQLPSQLTLTTDNIDVTLKDAATKASVDAGKHLETLKSGLSQSIDVATSDGRTSIKSAVTAARGVLAQGPKAIPLFQTWKALSDAATDEIFSKLPDVLTAAKSEIAKGLEWHERQTVDDRLRLKALASQTYVPPTDDDPTCPLCASPLDDDNKRALAAELETLRNNAAAAERKIADVCRGLREDIAATIPTAIQSARAIIDAMDPGAAYSSAMNEKFVTDAPFSSVLTGMATSAQAMIFAQVAVLPRFSYSAFVAAEHEPEPVRRLRREIHLLERLIALVTWWKTNRPLFVGAWNSLIGKRQNDGTFPSDSIEGQLAVIEQAIGHARPLDDLSRNLMSASGAAKTWNKINAVQQTRETIVEALAPLKDLRTLVASETASSIARLSNNIDALCKRIALRERLTYEEAVVSRKEVSITGSFSPGMRIDAALVANTSWLRTILWSFVFALREETIKSIGFNPLPLVVLDDPQATFDPRNRRKWAQELVRCANLPPTDMLGAQLLVTTHERSFYQMLMDHEKFSAQQGLVGGVNKVSGVATVANGGELTRLYAEAKASNDDAKAREYIRKLRIYCEDLLKFMLRSISSDIPDKTIQQLREEIKRLSKGHVAPFDRRAFDALVNALGDSNKGMQYINEPHHKDDETYGVAEAEVVKEFWDTTLLDRIHTAFSVFDTFELYTGEPRTFPWAKNIATFPNGFRSLVKSAEMLQTGVAAAAKSDGRAGDGALTFEEWTSGKKIALPNHEVFQLAAGTLDPIAGVGDLIIVSNYAKVRSRNLVVVACGSALLARRYNMPENHSEIVVLTGQSVDPLSLPPPVIVPPESVFRKIVGTLFTAHKLPVPLVDTDREFIEAPDPEIIDSTLKDARLFRVQGRSAEPIALEGQYLLTRAAPASANGLTSLDGRLIIGIDEDGARYFKRLRCHDKLAVLESLNPDGTTAAELLSLDGSHDRPRLTEALEVIGVLFELPGETDVPA